jgi:hypothetical protein
MACNSSMVARSKSALLSLEYGLGGNHMSWLTTRSGLVAVPRYGVASVMSRAGLISCHKSVR